MEENVMVKIKSTRYECAMVPVDPVSSNVDPDNCPREAGNESPDEPEVLEMMSSGTLSLDENRIVLSYAETELTGMEGSVTEISYPLDAPGLVSMCRTGAVTTTLVFEEGKRNHCIYQTPFMPFEVCVHTYRVNNRLAEIGVLDLDYSIEIRGARTERTHLEVRVTPFEGTNASRS